MKRTATGCDGTGPSPARKNAAIQLSPTHGRTGRSPTRPSCAANVTGYKDTSTCFSSASERTTTTNGGSSPTAAVGPSASVPDPPGIRTTGATDHIARFTSPSANSRSPSVPSVTPTNPPMRELEPNERGVSGRSSGRSEIRWLQAVVARQAAAKRRVLREVTGFESFATRRATPSRRYAVLQ